MWIQIALGLFPAMLICLIFLFAKKIKKMAYITLASAVTVSFLLCGALGAVEMFSGDDTSVSATKVTAALSKEDYKEAAYAFIRIGDTDSAERVVTEYADVYGYDEECTLMTSRISVLDRRYDAAFATYKKLYGDDLTEEAKAVERIVSFRRYDSVLADSLAQAGYEAPVEMKGSEIRALEESGVAELVVKALDKEKLGNDDRDAAEWVGKANAVFDEYENSGTVNEVKLNEVIGELEEYNEDKTMNKLEAFRDARLKALLLAGDFEEAIEVLNGHASCAEYMIVLDLYLGGKVSQSDLSKALDIENIDGVKELISQLEKIKDELEDELTEKEYIQLEDQIENLKSYKKDEVLFELEQKLESEAENERNYKLASKIYMSLAKIADECENDIIRNQHFSDALVTAPSSDDTAYAEAMNNIANTIAGTGETEAIKNITANATQAVENSYAIKGTGQIVRNEEKEKEQADVVQEYAIKAGAAVTINSVDPSEFETVVMKVQLSDEFLTERELKNLVRIKDCNYDISDAKIEKIEYDKANIILVCDNSGSMSGSVNSLKNAVNKFLDTSNKKETIGFYTFDDSIIKSLPLGTASIDDIRSAVNSMGSFGGTNIFGTLTSVLSSLSYVEDANQVIILMTDGQDGGNHDYASIESQIGNMAISKGYMVYVIGMGSSINYDYLTNIASSTGGQILYSPTDSQLEEMYQFIHGAIDNQYKITFTAEDTLTSNGRKVTVSLDGKNVSDTATYSVSNEDAENSVVPFDDGVAVRGLSKRLIYKKKKDVSVDVNGVGFKKGDAMSVTLKGDREYTLSSTFIDEGKFRITIPAYVAVGEYDIEINLNRRKAIFLKELTIVEGEPDEVHFGGYIFKAFNIEEYSDRIELSTYVTMNDWLIFNGAITLKGNVENSEMILSDHVGSYVDYQSSSSAKGYAKFLADNNFMCHIPQFGDLKIFNALASGTDYPTQPQSTGAMFLLELANFHHPEMRLYPDRITVEVDSGSTTLPFQDFFVSAVQKNADNSLFEFDFNATAVITKDNVDFKADLELKYQENATPVPVMLLDTKANIQKTGLGCHIDTLADLYEVEFNIKLPWCVVDTYVGAAIQWKEEFKFDGFQLKLDRNFTKPIGGIPITFSNFMLGVTGVSETIVRNDLEEVSGIAITGGLDVDAYKVSAVIPKLEEYVGDISLLGIHDAKFKCKLRQFSIEGSARLDLLSMIKLAENEIYIGNFSYSNALLGLSDEDVTGIHVVVKKGINVNMHNLELNIWGDEKEFTLTNRFKGFMYGGTAELRLNWWIFDKVAHADGHALIGFYTDHSDNTQFTIRVSKTENGKRKGAIFYIYDNGHMDYDLNYKY